MRPTIQVINESTLATDEQVQAAVAALQIQLDRDFAPVWGNSATLQFIAKGGKPTADAWWIAVLDDLNVAGALGYHDLTDAGLPAGHIGVRDCINDKSSWTVDLSHELLEMLADPYINLVASIESDKGITLVAYENCDAVESDADGYTIDGIAVSDFVFPCFFEPGSREQKFDFRGLLTKPFEIRPDGYLSVLHVRNGRGWQQVNGDHATVRKHQDRAQRGTRREKRRVGSHAFERSARLAR